MPIGLWVEYFRVQNTVDSANNDFGSNKPATTSKNCVTRKVIRCWHQTMLIVKNFVYRPIVLFHSIVVSVTQCQGHMKVRLQKSIFILVVFFYQCVARMVLLNRKKGFYGQCYFHACIRKVMFLVLTINRV